MAANSIHGPPDGPKKLKWGESEHACVLQQGPLQQQLLQQHLN